MVTKQQWRAMLALARPMVARDVDYQEVQHTLLNHFDFLTNSDEHEELTMDVIRQCETEIELKEDK